MYYGIDGDDDSYVIVPREELMFLMCKKCQKPIVFRAHANYKKFSGTCCYFIWDADPIDKDLKFFRIIGNRSDPTNVVPFPRR